MSEEARYLDQVTDGLLKIEIELRQLGAWADRKTATGGIPEYPAILSGYHGLYPVVAVRVSGKNENAG